MSKKMSSKLADSLRQAREGRPASAPAATTTPPKQESKPTPPPRPRAPAAEYARQADQAPPSSLDRTWDNLHPERIWPD